MIRKFRHAIRKWNYVFCIDAERQVIWSEYSDGTKSVESPLVGLLGNWLEVAEKFVKDGEWLEVDSVDVKV